MELTKKKADELCYEKWNWHYHNPGYLLSGSWPRWEFNSGDLPPMLCNCPYCELYDNSVGISYNCKECPLATSGHKCEDTFDKNDYWYKWNYANSNRTRKKYAKLIRDIAGKRLGFSGDE